MQWRWTMKVSELTNHCDDILLSRKTPKRDVQTFSWDGERGAEVMCRNVPEMQVGLRAADEKLCTRAYTVSCLFSSFNVCDAPLCQHHWLSVARAFPPSLTAHFPLLPLVPGTFLVNCRNKLYDKSTTNRMELKGYVIVDRLVVNSHDSSTVV